MPLMMHLEEAVVYVSSFLLQVTGNVKSAMGSVKETVGAAVGAKQMEADGTCCLLLFDKGVSRISTLT